MCSYTHAERGRIHDDTGSGSRCHTQKGGIERGGLATIHSGGRAEGAQKGTRDNTVWRGTEGADSPQSESGRKGYAQNGGTVGGGLATILRGGSART